ncbi:hypothetical protein EAG_03220 [Camponotus floridanus]|uniref:Uncharacterized protein n=1 Tax=Camponotus floridanus TaxID=104421 RepID=E2A671_CAMFO|nr:hypothetical protein EAG_03220 [Camponotus floridanus]
MAGGKLEQIGCWSILRKLELTLDGNFGFAAWNETGFGSESDRHARRCRSRRSKRLREAVLIRDTIITTTITMCIIITPTYTSLHRTSSAVVPSDFSGYNLESGADDSDSCCCLEGLQGNLIYGRYGEVKDPSSLSRGS